MVGNGLDVEQFRDTVRLDLDVIDRSRTRRGTTDMEGTHRQLCARLTDGLCRNHADGFADVDAMSASKVTTVTLRTHAIPDFTGDRRTHDDVID